jgi:hypothetical protein
VPPHLLHRQRRSSVARNATKCSSGEGCIAAMLSDNDARAHRLRERRRRTDTAPQHAPCTLLKSLRRASTCCYIGHAADATAVACRRGCHRCHALLGLTMRGPIDANARLCCCCALDGAHRLQHLYLMVGIAVCAFVCTRECAAPQALAHHLQRAAPTTITLMQRFVSLMLPPLIAAAAYVVAAHGAQCGEDPTKLCPTCL